MGDLRYLISFLSLDLLLVCSHKLEENIKTCLWILNVKHIMFDYCILIFVIKLHYPNLMYTYTSIIKQNIRLLFSQ